MIPIINMLIIPSSWGSMTIVECCCSIALSNSLSPLSGGVASSNTSCIITQSASSSQMYLWKEDFTGKHFANSSKVLLNITACGTSVTVTVKWSKTLNGYQKSNLPDCNISPFLKGFQKSASVRTLKQILATF